MSQLVRLEGKDTTQSAHCALEGTKNTGFVSLLISTKGVKWPEENCKDKGFYLFFSATILHL